jgi:hypothetical protein
MCHNCVAIVEVVKNGESVVDETLENARKPTALLQGVGVLADVAAVSALFIVGGAPIVWAMSAAAILTGAYLIWRRWQVPVDKTLVIAVSIALAGAGVFGYALGERGNSSSAGFGNNRESVKSAESSRQVPVRTSTVTSSRDVPKNTPTQSAPSVANSTSGPRSVEVFHTGNATLFSNTNGNEIDLETGEELLAKSSEVDLHLEETSLDAINRAQVFSLGPISAQDPSYETCTGVDSGKWQFSLSAERVKPNHAYCFRANEESFGYFVVQQADTDGPGKIDNIQFRWTVWRYVSR